MDFTKFSLVRKIEKEKEGRREGRKERRGKEERRKKERKGIMIIMILMMILRELKYLVPNLAYDKGSMIAILLINETTDIYEISPLSYHYLSLI